MLDTQKFRIGKIELWFVSRVYCKVGDICNVPLKLFRNIRFKESRNIVALLL